ncbi:glycosyltransferase [Singulisphaera acidiphila]|uniref:Glycosyltransferase n=1 Tax=Singulisphaera acidiphila (strain ATCC BAA-1392 / DSM 18658 / VKM B-2454 / MOB10) TaxID=886293 RepID=L0DDN6_SINAD|nr:glycosyltransferase [Singulisphaera acidiphila]AGA26781.1 glycosyltransferase [Singulisphaera acidiphila DSM 18658]
MIQGSGEDRLRVGRRTVVAHLTASPFFGGPERQMIGLATSLPADVRSVFLAFTEGGRARPFLEALSSEGVEALELRENKPHYRAAVHEVARQLVRIGADVLCCHGYKPDILGWLAARQAGIPVIAVSRGWTAATVKVRFNEGLDRLCLRGMDRVVCVSEGQAVKVRCAGVSTDRVIVIRNAIRAARFDSADPADGVWLRGLFPTPPSRVVGAAGRLSPEKGFGVLVEAARRVVRENSDVGFVIFGDGPLHADLERQIGESGLADRFLLAGFRDDLDRIIPHFDLFTLPSFTEGLPNVALEASAASVPVVATAVGGTPEVIEEGVNGRLVPPGDAAALADRLLDALRDDEGRWSMGRRGRQRVQEQFTFEAQASHYHRLFDELTSLAPGYHHPAVG